MGAYLDLDDVTRHNPHAKAQLDKLIRERDEARAEVEQLRAEILAQMTRQAQAQGEYDERQRDAERYRWMQANTMQAIAAMRKSLRNRDLNAAIKAAMREGE